MIITIKINEIKTSKLNSKLLASGVKKYFEYIYTRQHFLDYILVSQYLVEVYNNENKKFYYLLKIKFLMDNFGSSSYSASKWILLSVKDNYKPIMVPSNHINYIIKKIKENNVLKNPNYTVLKSLIESYYRYLLEYE